MVLSLLLIIFIFAVVAYQVSQGFFSALINVVLAVCCASLALGSYEWMAQNWFSGWSGRESFGYTLAITLTFGVSLLVTRLIFDMTIKRAPLLPAWLDRGGAGVLGFFYGWIVAGVFAVALLQLPMSWGTIGYAGIPVIPFAQLIVPPNEDDDEKPLKAIDPSTIKEQPLWLSPDRLALGLTQMMSTGLFSGSSPLYANRPDLVQSIIWVNTTHFQNPRYAPPNAIQEILKYDRSLKYVYQRSENHRRQVTMKPIPAPDGKDYVLLRFRLDPKAKGEQKMNLFAPRQIRLVGQYQGKWVQYPAMALQSQEEGQQDKHIATKSFRGQDGYFHVIDHVFQPQSETPNDIEVVFTIPEDFNPLYLAYKTGAYKLLPSSGEEADGVATTGSQGLSERLREAADQNDDNQVPEATTHYATGSETNPDGTVKAVGRGGRARGASAYSGTSFFGNRLPMQLTKYRQQNNAEVSRGQLKNGHLIADVEAQGGGGRDAVSEFDVDSDKRLLQLNVKALEALSLYGRAKEQAITSVQNYFVVDERGHRYKIIGKYITATVHGREIFEVQYFPEQIGSLGGLGKFSEIDERHLPQNYDMFYLFLVDPGARIVEFSTGGSGTRADDLSGENLVAPN